eukprot:m.111295 g.111295  ORF g.111295 m.111295 type:complete len:483 (-) comp15949_c1_seq1:1040-2488(-)
MFAIRAMRRVGLLQLQPTRLLATTAVPPEISNRKRFRMTQPSKALTQRIEDLQVGRRRVRVAKAKSQELQEKLQTGKQAPLRVFAEKRLKFVASATAPSSFPHASARCTEVAFVGRSNVGKSSLLNALTASKPARTSAKPGLTQSVNFYRLCDELHIVDMPGYGFAFAKAEKVSQWQETALAYISERSALKRLFLLLDARHGLKVNDKKFLEQIEKIRSPRIQLVLTKCDLVLPIDLARRATLVAEEAKAYRKVLPEVVFVSSQASTGVAHLQRIIAHCANLPMATVDADNESDGGTAEDDDDDDGDSGGSSRSLRDGSDNDRGSYIMKSSRGSFDRADRQQRRPPQSMKPGRRESWRRQDDGDDDDDDRDDDGDYYQNAESKAAPRRAPRYNSNSSSGRYDGKAENSRPRPSHTSPRTPAAYNNNSKNKYEGKEASSRPRSSPTSPRSAQPPVAPEGVKAFTRARPGRTSKAVFIHKARKY